jgi:dihydroxyacetone kinase DhaKLM complex PTS-EIIA-like component DhaM
VSVPNVGIVIVSHSPKIAEGAAIVAAIDRAWSAAGVAILVDLGGAETNSEMAIEMLDAARRDKVVVCEAPIVEGAVMAATEASGGSTLDAVRHTAEELAPT